MKTRTVRLGTPDGELRIEALVLNPEADVANIDEVIPLERFEQATRALRHLATVIKQQIAELAPDKVGLEIGLAVGIESGELTSLIVKGSGAANVKVTLEWGRDA